MSLDQIGDARERARAEWVSQDTAEAWQKHYSPMKDQLAEVTAAIVAAAAPQPGENVLDLASGTGEPAIPIAGLVAPTGRVTATDLNPAMLKMLERNAVEQGVGNLDTRVVDAQELPFRDQSFDLVTSRFGAMFFIEIERALQEIRRVLRPGGRLALLVWGLPAPGTFFGDLLMPFFKRMEEAPDPDGPSPLRFAEPGKLADFVRRAGFANVAEAIDTVRANWKGSPEQMLDSTFEIAAPFRKAVETMTAEAKNEAREEALATFRPRYDGAYTHSLAPILVVTARA